MTSLLILSIVTAISLFVISLLGNERLRGVSVLLSFFLIGFWFTQRTDDSGDTLVYLALIPVLIAGLLSLLDQQKMKWLSYVLPPVVAVYLIITTNGKLVLIGDVPTAAMNKFVLMGTIVGSLAFSAVKIKQYFISKLRLESPELGGIVELIFSGIALYLGFFGASVFGLFIVGVVLIVGSILVQKSFPIGLLLSSILLFAIYQSQDVVTQADTLLGLLLGLSLGLLANKSATMEKGLVLWSFFTMVMSGVFAYSIGYAGEMHPSMGGADAILALLLGISIKTLYLKSSKEISLSGSSYYFIIPFLILFTPLDKGENNKNNALNVETSEVETEIKELFLPLNGELEGRYKLIVDSSRVDFFLGEEGETKGAFKRVAGNIFFSESPEKNSCDIELKMSDFTTFNKFRDESLMGEEYFMVDKYPEMSFKAQKAVKVNDDTFKFVGEFRMLGKSNPLEVTFERKDTKDSTIILVGEGTIDRTKFGMTPSITEGNIVTFNYTVQLQK